MAHHTAYYINQIGGGGGIAGEIRNFYVGEIRNFYVGSRYQRGHGIGSLLDGLFRRVLAYLRSGARAVGREAVKTGLNVADNVLLKGADFKEAAQDRTREAKKI